MTTRNLTAQQIEDAEALGMTADEYKAVLDEQELPKGLYTLKIAGGKVEMGKDGFFKDAIQLNLRFQVLDSNGNVAKRYGSKFQRITLPVANGAFTPTAIGRSTGIAALNWLSAATGVSVKQIVADAKSMAVPAGFIDKTIVGNYTMRQDKNDSEKFWPEIKPVQPGAKPVAVKPDGANSGSAAAQAASNAGLAPVDASDADVPF